MNIRVGCVLIKTNDNQSRQDTGPHLHTGCSSICMQGHAPRTPPAVKALVIDPVY